MVIDPIETIGPYYVDPPKRRPVSRPRKIRPEIDHDFSSTTPYDEGFWYCYATPDDDDAQFERLLIDERKILEACPEPELPIYWDCHIRALAQIYNREFSTEGLLNLSTIARAPYTHDGQLTPGGTFKARVLLCCGRIHEGNITQEGRKPDISKLKDYLPPFVWALMVERA